MGQVNRHLETIAYKDATVAEADFVEHLVHGAGSTGTYIKFTPAFGGVPHVIAMGFGSTVVLDKVPVAGSFKLEDAAAGTISANYVAWGAR